MRSRTASYTQHGFPTVAPAISKPISAPLATIRNADHVDPPSDEERATTRTEPESARSSRSSQSAKSVPSGRRSKLGIRYMPEGAPSPNTTTCLSDNMRDGGRGETLRRMMIFKATSSIILGMQRASLAATDPKSALMGLVALPRCRGTHSRTTTGTQKQAGHKAGEMYPAAKRIFPTRVAITPLSLKSLCGGGVPSFCRFLSFFLHGTGAHWTNLLSLSALTGTN